MQIRKSILTTAAGVMLAALSGMTPASASPQKQSSPAVAKQSVPKSNNKSVTGVSQGTMTSIDNDQLVLSHMKKGKAEEMTFMLSPKTERKGNLTPGSQISVHYKTENNQLMATAVQAMPQKTASHSAKPVVKD